MSGVPELGAGGLAEWSWRPSATVDAVPARSLFVRMDAIGVMSGELPLVGAIRAASVPLAILRPGAVSVPIRHPKIKTRGFAFPQGAGWAKPDADQPLAAAPSLAAQAPARDEAGAERRFTRIKPPGDIIKLEDRLFYVLQPPLETIVANQALHFPFHPFSYQFEGIAFLYPRYAAILADEMGLGKTMQAITAIRLLLHAGEIRRVLLVCPKPLVTNWQREFHLWAPEAPLMVIEGEQAKRHWQWRLPDSPIKIANYELLQRDREVLAEPDLHFDLVVLDESQRIKNRSNATSQIVRSISRSRNWALTGTPVENSPEDLVGIFEFLSPGYLTSGMKPRRMGKLASDYVLRRTKDKVLAELPPKMFRDADVALTPEQRETYRLAEEEGVLRLTELGQGATIQHVFELVLRLKQICNFDPATGESAKLERLAADMEEIAASGQKALVFSQWVGTLNQLDRRLKSFHPLSYHGGVPSRKRDEVLREQGKPQAVPTAHQLWRRQRGPELAVRPVRVSLRPLVEPGRRRPGHQPRASHRRRRPGDGHALSGPGHDRRADQPDSRREARDLRHDLFRHRAAQARRPDAARDLRAVSAQVP